MAVYTISIQDLQYRIINTSNYTLQISLKKQVCNSDWETVLNFILTEGDLYTFENLIDNHYLIEIQYTDLENEVIIQNVEILNFLELFGNIAEDLIVLFCKTKKDPCSSCEDVDVCTLLSSIYAKMEQYKRVMFSVLKPYLQNMYSLTNCEEVHQLECHIASEFIKGKYILPEKALKRLIALDFIAIYKYFELNSISSLIPNFENIKETYKLDDILCCIKDSVDLSLEDFVLEGNLPPSVIGNKSLNLQMNPTSLNYTLEDFVFSLSDFSYTTTPIYSDPENDGPFKVKILSLPEIGTLKLNNIDVIVNQEILFSDVSQGLLVYVPADFLPQSNEVTFAFTIADTGSLSYSSQIGKITLIYSPKFVSVEISGRPKLTLEGDISDLNSTSLVIQLTAIANEVNTEFNPENLNFDSLVPFKVNLFSKLAVVDYVSNSIQEVNLLDYFSNGLKDLYISGDVELVLENTDGSVPIIKKSWTNKFEIPLSEDSVNPDFQEIIIGNLSSNLRGLIKIKATNLYFLFKPENGNIKVLGSNYSQDDLIIIENSLPS